MVMRKFHRLGVVAIPILVLALIVGPIGVPGRAADSAQELGGFVPNQEWDAGRHTVRQVFIRLDLPSVAELAASTEADAALQRRHARAILDQQHLMRERLEGLVVDELASLVVAANGFRALVEVADIPSIAAVEGVHSVAAVSTYRPARVRPAPVAPAIVPGANATGKGITVGVIDTGIDYTHLTFQTPGPDQPFSDVGSDHTFHSDIAWLAAQGITRGCDTARALFCPDQSVTRGELAAFLVRALDLPNGSVTFVDDDDSPFEREIERLAAAGITHGCDSSDSGRDGRHFCPDRPVTRAEMASMLVGALGFPPADGGAFSDIEGTHATAAAALAAAGVTEGCGEDRFCPDRPLSRGEMAAFLRRSFQAAGLDSVPVPEPYDGATIYATNDAATIEEGSFPRGRVVGGFDLAGTDYQPASESASPDSDPLDRHGHGTQVASLISGRNGVAPEADLLAFKVFGDSGDRTDLVADAVELALDPDGDLSVDDAVDVINLSLVPEVAHSDDPAALALQHASDLGVVVVTAADERGQRMTSTDGPLAVAGAAPPDSAQPALMIDGATLPVAAPPSNLEFDPVTARLVAAVPRDGCTPLRDDVSGAIVLVQRGLCTFNHKVRNAAAAGAAGVVIVDDATAPASIEGTYSLPVVLIAEDASLTPGTTVTIDPRATTVGTDVWDNPPLAVAMSADLVAADWGIGAVAGSGSEHTGMSGTSAATAYVSGTAAALLEAIPGLDASAVKATLVATGEPLAPDEDDSPVPGDPISLDPGRALGVGTWVSPVTVSEDGGGVSISFDLHHLEGTARYDIEVITPEDPELEPTEPIVSGDGAVTQVTIPSIETTTGPTTIWIEVTNREDANDRLRIPVTVGSDSGPGVNLKEGPELRIDGSGTAEGFWHLPDTGDVAIGMRLADDDRLEIGLSVPTAWISPGQLEAVFLIDTDRDGTDDYALLATDHGRLRGGPSNGELATALIRLDGAGGPAGYLVPGESGDRVTVLSVDIFGERGFLGEPGPFDVTPMVVTPTGTIEVGVTRTVDPFKWERLPGTIQVSGGDEVVLDSYDEATLWLFPDNPVSGQHVVVAPAGD